MPSHLSQADTKRLKEAAGKVLNRAYIARREATQRPIMAACAIEVARAFILQGNRLVKLMKASEPVLLMVEDGVEVIDPHALDTVITQMFIDTKQSILDATLPHVRKGLASGWKLGAGRALGPLRKMATRLKITEAGPGVAAGFGLSNPRAVAYVEEHGAALVSNINESTRKQIHDIVRDATANGQGYGSTAKAIKDRFAEFAVPKPQAHIANRATLVAVTEVGQAYEDGIKDVGSWLQSQGLPMAKFWQTVEDSRVSDECAANEAIGWIALDDAFPSGDDAPLRFPGCRCALLTQLYDPGDMGEIPGLDDPRSGFSLEDLAGVVGTVQTIWDMPDFVD